MPTRPLLQAERLSHPNGLLGADLGPLSGGTACPCKPSRLRKIERGGSMADYTIKSLSEVSDVLGDYPGEMRLATYEIDAEQAALTWRRMPAQTGGKGSYGHRHRTQE